jgi:hypothetical protein
VFLALGAAALLTACGGVSTPSTSASEKFTGTIPVGGRGPVHSFTLSKLGEYTVTLTDLTPATGNPIGVGFGNPSGADCAITSAQPVIRGQQPFGGSLAKGTYCLVLYDPGSMAQSENYTVTVVHP